MGVEQKLRHGKGIAESSVTPVPSESRHSQTRLLSTIIRYQREMSFTLGEDLQEHSFTLDEE